MSDNKSNRRVFAIYGLATPGGTAPTDLAPALTRVLEAHRQRHGSPPAGLVVNKTVIGEAVEVVKAMGNGLQVTTSGGCLAWECWVEVATDGQKPSGKRPSLASRAMKVQLEMTQARAREILAEQLAMFEEATR
jgi:phage-related tail protein